MARIRMAANDKLFAVFAALSVTFLVSAVSVKRTYSELVASKEAQASAVGALGSLKDMQQVLADLNLVAMDIIVDYQNKENGGKVSDERQKEFSDLMQTVNDSQETWIKSESAVGIKAETETVIERQKLLISHIQELIAVLNGRGIKGDELSAFDDKIDNENTGATKIVEELRATVEKKFAEAQLEMDGLHGTLLFELTAAFICCMIIIFGVGVPVVMSVTKKLGGLQRDLANIGVSINDTSSTMSDVSQSLARNSSESAAALQESVSAMTEIGSMIRQTSQNGKATSELAQRVIEQAKLGSANMDEMGYAMKDITTASERLRDIQKIIKDIARKTNVIDDVVFKTQLLAVNASIEAARAGQHGKGFAVVATEVASLATLSGKASDEINELLNSSIDQVTNIIERTSESVKRGEAMCEKSSKSFADISSSIHAVSERISSIQSATKEQELGVDQTTTAMAAMNESTTATNSTAIQNATVSTELKDQADQLLKVANDIREAVSRRLPAIAAGSLKVGVVASAGHHSHLEAKEASSGAAKKQKLLNLVQTVTNDIDRKGA